MRVPAQLVEIEESILAACLLFPKMRDEALDILSHADFYKPNHGKIFKAICDLTQKHEVADLLTVSAALSGQIDSVMSMIAEISNNPVPTDMASYCHKIVNCRQLRDAQAILSRAFDRCFDPKADFSALMDEATSGLSDIDMGTLGSSFLTMSELTQRSAERYSCLKNGEDMPGIRTGFRTIDRLTGGFRNSQLIIIAGRPGTGKTAFACNLLAHMASAGNQCGFFSLEMSADELDDRWNAAEARVNSAVLKFGGRIDDSTWAKLIDAFERKSKWPVLVDDTPASISELKRRAKLMKRSGAKIIFIDQLSHIKPDQGDRSKSTWEANSKIVEELAYLKKELRIPIILLAQLNRDLEKRADRKPQLSDLKNTGALEEHADIVLLGYRPFLYTQDPNDETKAEWNIAKHRGGPTWTIPMRWDGKQTKFFEMEVAGFGEGR